MRATIVVGRPHHGQVPARASSVARSRPIKLSQPRAVRLQSRPSAVSVCLRQQGHRPFPHSLMAGSYCKSAANRPVQRSRTVVRRRGEGILRGSEEVEWIPSRMMMYATPAPTSRATAMMKDGDKEPLHGSSSSFSPLARRCSRRCSSDSLGKQSAVRAKSSPHEQPTSIVTHERFRWGWPGWRTRPTVSGSHSIVIG